MRKVIFLSVLVALILAPLAMATSADKVTFYGRACVWTGMTSKDADYVGNGSNTASTPYWSDSDTDWGIKDARIGFDFKVSDTVSAKVEIRSNLVSTNMTRHWYGAWQFNQNGKLIVGHTWSPLFNGLGETNMADWGDFQGSLREDGLQVHMNVGGGSLKIGALSPNTSSAPAGVYSSYTADTDATLPKLEVSYSRKISIVDFMIGAGYNTSTIEFHRAVANATEYSYDVDSYAVGGTFAIDFKPAYVKGYVYMGQNMSEYGWQGLHEDALGAAFYTNASGTSSLVDADYLGYGLIGGFVANDMFTFEGYYFHMESERSYSVSSTTYDYETEGDVFGVIAVVKLADNVYVYPEIVKMDCGDYVYTTNGVAPTGYPLKMGSYTKYGIYWRINF